MIFVIGGRGRLGRALLERYPAQRTVAIERAVYERWSDDAARPAITEFFASRAEPGSVIYICSGLLDAKLPVSELNQVNLALPCNVIRAVAQLGVQVVTFGTAMEGTLTSNPYVQSKLDLARFVEQTKSVTGSVTHIRIHTLYGMDEPSPFMFLGLMLDALRHNRPFNMTLGRQLREYHHVSDDAVAIQQLIASGVVGPVTLSHGAPVTLVRLAEAVFESQDKAELLRVGAVPEPAQENFSHTFERPAALVGVEFRDSLSGVAHYMKSLVDN